MPFLRYETRQTLNTQVAAEERLSHVDVLQLHLNIVHLAVGLLRAAKLAAGAEER